MTDYYSWNEKFSDKRFNAGARNDKFYASLSRKSEKTKRYWFDLQIKGNKRSNFSSGNLLEIDNAFLENAAEAKKHYVNAVESLIQRLQEIKAEIERMEIND